MSSRAPATFVESAISTPCFLRMRAIVLAISRSVPVNTLRHHLDDEHLGAEPRVDGRELEADDAAADDEQRLRNSLEANGVVGIDDRFAVARPRLDVDRRAAGRDDDRIRGRVGFAWRRRAFSSDTRLGPANDASPYANVTLFALKSVLTPPTFALTTESVNAATPARSTSGAATLRPILSASRMWRVTSPTCSSALVGMQPQFRQTPPTSSRSMQTTFLPSCPSRIAA